MKEEGKLMRKRLYKRRRYIYWLVWFIRNSYSFVGATNVITYIVSAMPRAHTFAQNMCKWEALSEEVREAWYLSGEDRTFEI